MSTEIVPLNHVYRGSQHDATLLLAAYTLGARMTGLRYIAEDTWLRKSKDPDTLNSLEKQFNSIKQLITTISPPSRAKLAQRAKIEQKINWLDRALDLYKCAWISSTNLQLSDEAAEFAKFARPQDYNTNRKPQGRFDTAVSLEDSDEEFRFEYTVKFLTVSPMARTEWACMLGKITEFVFELPDNLIAIARLGTSIAKTNLPTISDPEQRGRFESEDRYLSITLFNEIAAQFDSLKRFFPWVPAPALKPAAKSWNQAQDYIIMFEHEFLAPIRQCADGKNSLLEETLRIDCLRAEERNRVYEDELKVRKLTKSERRVQSEFTVAESEIRKFQADGRITLLECFKWLCENTKQYTVNSKKEFNTWYKHLSNGNKKLGKSVNDKRAGRTISQTRSSSGSAPDDPEETDH